MATYPDDATESTTSLSMINTKPDRGFQQFQEFKVETFESQAGYEKRRLVTRRPKRQYNLSYTNVSGAVKKAIEDFYTARNGSFESFIFDLSHVNDSGTLNVRFDSPLRIEHIISGGTGLLENVYTISFNIKETWD